VFSTIRSILSGGSGELMNPEIVIDGKKINADSDCYVIAELGNNHGGSIEVCKEMIKAAKEAGADAVKLQKRDNQTLYTHSMLNKPYENPNSYGATYGEHREKLELDIDAFKHLQEYSKQIGITFFSTAFDIKSADQLESINVPAYKIASGDLKTIPLLKHVAKFGKPMIISTGGANMVDVERAFNAIYPINKQLIVLQCTAGYPPAFEELNLNVIKTFMERFPVIVGLSSHDSGIAMALASYVLGGRMVEKHFTLNRAMKGTDHAFSLEPQGMRKMVRDLRRVRVALGDGVKKQFECEAGPIEKMGKSIVANRSLPAGHILTESDLALKSPGGGTPPYEWDQIIGKKVKVSYKEDDSVRLADLS
jgi:sialic acid synthase